MKHPKLLLSIAGILVVLISHLSATAQNDSPQAESEQSASNNPVFGKYTCTASKYRNGSYEFVPRGSFVITKDGKYTYNGFEKPSKGTFTIDKAGSLFFKGGYLNGGQATKIDRPNKFFLVFPTIPDNRWTCGLVR